MVSQDTNRGANGKGGRWGLARNLVIVVCSGDSEDVVVGRYTHLWQGTLGCFVLADQLARRQRYGSRAHGFSDELECKEGRSGGWGEWKKGSKAGSQLISRQVSHVLDVPHSSGG